MARSYALSQKHGKLDQGRHIMTSRAIVLSGALLLLAVQAQAEDKIHELKASPTTVHRGFFDASLKPVLTIDSGDIVRLWTTTGNPRYFESARRAEGENPARALRRLRRRARRGRDDHTLTGPIAVRGAEIGDTVEIKIRSIELWLPIGAHELSRQPRLAAGRFPYSRDRVFFFDPAKKAIEFAPGVVVPTKPFWGVIGVAPPRVDGARAERPAQRLRRQHGQSRSAARHQSVPAGPLCGRADLRRRRPRRAGQRRSRNVGDGDLAAEAKSR